MAPPLMPKATAVWLVDNTTLTFEQIAAFCELHLLEVSAIADGEVAVGIVGLDPMANDQLTQEEINRCTDDPSARLVMREQRDLPVQKARRTRYTPLSKRQDKPDAIAWLIRNHPEVNDAQIGKLLGTTKNTIRAVRERTHWNSPNIRSRDPVLLGLCTQTDLNAVVTRANARGGKAKPAPAPDLNQPQRIVRPDPVLEVALKDVTESEPGADIDLDNVFTPKAKPEGTGAEGEN
ncbi:MAG: cell cycle transcriptional regulator TrcR [Pseudomonadota bacterium]|nr:cell cycle transcriptional regulator TrcR [Pseudomonadota bacterium]